MSVAARQRDNENASGALERAEADLVAAEVAAIDAPTNKAIDRVVEARGARDRAGIVAQTHRARLEAAELEAKAIAQKEAGVKLANAEQRASVAHWIEECRPSFDRLAALEAEIRSIVGTLTTVTAKQHAAADEAEQIARSLGKRLELARFAVSMPTPAELSGVPPRQAHSAELLAQITVASKYPADPKHVDGFVKIAGHPAWNEPGDARIALPSVDEWKHAHALLGSPQVPHAREKAAR